MLRIVVALGVLASTLPALAEPMSADAARRFVAGKQFAFNCFDGSVGQGRIFPDGSVAGVIKMGGSGPVRFIHLPGGTLFSKGERVCSYVKGAFFNPCFNVEKTSANSFRGAVSGFGFAYCDFTSKHGREMVASVITGPENLPLPMPRSIRRGAKGKHPGETTASTASTSSAPKGETSPPAAAPTAPVKSEPLPAPSMGETGMRGSVQ